MTPMDAPAGPGSSFPIERLAKVVVEHCGRVRAGDLVTILAEPSQEATVAAVAECVLRSGGHPSFHPRSTRLDRLLLRAGSEDQLRHVCPFERHRLEHCDVLIVLHAPSEPDSGPPIPAARRAQREAARGSLRTASMRRAAEGQMRYVLAGLPTPTAARDAGMTMAGYERFVAGACFLDRPDPVAAWQTLHAMQARLCARLEEAGEVRVIAPLADGRDGTDLTIDTGGARWINCGGSENMPDGEVFTAPKRMQGVLHVDVPARYQGETVLGIRLVFRDNVVVDASAATNEAHLLAMLDADGGARTACELAIGTHPGITRLIGDPFYDEKAIGTFHVAIGAGYPESGSDNESGVHWDIVGDLRHGGRILADGVELFGGGALRVR